MQLNHLNLFVGGVAPSAMLCEADFRFGLVRHCVVEVFPEG